MASAECRLCNRHRGQYEIETARQLVSFLVPDLADRTHSMTHRPIAYNLVRLIFGALQTTPRGVDRIDFGYLSHLFEHWPADCVGVMPTAWGIRFFPRERILRGRAALAAMWQEAGDAGADPALLRLKARFADASVPAPRLSRRRTRISSAGLGRVLRLVLGEGFQVGRPMADLPRDAIYLDVGHFGLSWPMMVNWLGARPDIAPVFMLHDVLPLDFPEFFAPDTVAGHRKVMAVAAKYARALIVPTPSVARAVGARLDAMGARAIPIHPVALPIDRLFSRAVTPDPDLVKHPYFVVCGAIEPRKNHALLINVWRDLVAKFGAGAPRLVIAGSPGYASAELIAMLGRSETLRGHVLLATGLASPAMARLMAGARAVLMPSLAEGFGLPPIEALALGTPAVLSDIAAHRDAAGEFGLFIDPTDGPGWRRMIESLMADSAEVARARAQIARFTPLDWSGYMTKITAVLASVD